MNRPNQRSPRRPAEPKEYLLCEQTPFVVQEAYKTLRTNIMFALPGSECKCIGVTSPVSGDGKSTTSVNLAIALAQIGKRVLLMDCDMRLPTVAKKLGIHTPHGLSDFLINQVRIDEAICNVAEHGLHVLPAGSIPADPTGLLESSQIEHLFTALRRNYEYVIVDLPPVTAVSDAVILSKCLDGFLLTVRQKKTSHRTVEEALWKMRMTDTRILGAVVNGSEFNTRPYEKYNKGYYKK